MFSEQLFDMILDFGEEWKVGNEIALLLAVYRASI
jgi:hypothetical protein